MMVSMGVNKRALEAENDENCAHTAYLPDRLPSFKQVESNRDAYIGPTEESNWVIPGRVLMGAYPAEVDDAAHEKLLRGILACGVTTFVCLQKEYDHSSKDPSDWKRGTKIRPYIEDAFRIARRGRDAKTCAPDALQFMHVPIADCDVGSDGAVAKLATALCWRVLAGEVLYIHCWGGHGRTGTLVAIMLGMLYSIPKAEALKRTQLYHDLRTCSLHVPSPQTFSQRMQVLRILGTVQNQPSILEMHAKDPKLWRKMRTVGDEFLLPIRLGQQSFVGGSFGENTNPCNKKRKITAGGVISRGTPRPLKPPPVALSNSPTSGPSTIIPKSYRAKKHTRTNLGLLR